MKINGSSKQFAIYMLITTITVALFFVPLGNLMSCETPRVYEVVQSAFATCHEQWSATIEVFVLAPVGVVAMVCAVVNRLVYARDYLKQKNRVKQ